MKFSRLMVVVCCLVVFVTAINEKSLAKTPKSHTRKLSPELVYFSKVVAITEQAKPHYHKLAENMDSVKSFRKLYKDVPNTSQWQRMEETFGLTSIGLESIGKLKKINPRFRTISPVPSSLKKANTLLKRYAFRFNLFLSSAKSWYVHNKQSDYINARRYLDESAILFEKVSEELSVNS